MAKRPAAGQTKTRLMPLLSAAEAAALYACFLRDVLAIARAVSSVTHFVAYSPADEETKAYFAALAPDFQLIPQVGETLGERLDFVLSTCLQRGFSQAAALNSDSPDLPTAYLSLAFKRLDDAANDVVLGPCDDGGYYLIGWKVPHPRMVVEVRMSTDQVLADTMAIAAEEGLTIFLLPSWYDVDSVVELRRLEKSLGNGDGTASHTERFLRERSHVLADEF